MSRGRRSDCIGRLIVERNGSLLLHEHPRDGAGRKAVVRWRTGFSADHGEREKNLGRLRPLHLIVGACVEPGLTREEIDGVLAGGFDQNLWNRVPRFAPRQALVSSACFAWALMLAIDSAPCRRLLVV